MTRPLFKSTSLIKVRRNSGEAKTTRAEGQKIRAVISVVTCVNG